MNDSLPIRIADVDSTGQLYNWLNRNFALETIRPAQYHEADYLICGDFGYRHESFERVKIFFTGENHAPNLNDYDYCLTPEWEENERCFRLPYWQLAIFGYDEYREAIVKPRPVLTADELRAQNRDFCAFVCRNAVCKKRNRFVRKLDARKGVHCAGPLMNNIGGILPPGSAAKWEYVGKHLFNVSYENESHPGYQTEKILDAFLARSIPVYWGSPTVTKEFNPKAFVNAHDFRSDEELIDYLLELSQDYERMAAMLNEPIFRDPQVLEKAEERLRTFFAGIFARGPQAIQRTRWQRINAVLSRFYGHGLIRTYRRISRAIRGKKNNNLGPE